MQRHKWHGHYCNWGRKMNCSDLPHHFNAVPYDLHVHIAGPVGMSHKVDLRKISLGNKYAFNYTYTQ